MLHYRGHQLSYKVDSKVHNIVEQSRAPGEERKLIKVSEVGRAPKEEQWKSGGIWWSSLKSGDLSLYPGESSLRILWLTSSPPQ